MKGNHRIGAAILLVFLWAIQGCGKGADDTPVSNREGVVALPMTSLVDDDYPEAAAGDPGWEYAAAISIDLDGDDSAETIVLVANVSLFNGIPGWNDGQVWQAYVEEPTGERTDLYRQYIQLGNVSLAVSADPDNESPAILLAENTASHIRMIEIRYHSPENVSAREVFSRDLLISPEPMRPTEYNDPAHLDPGSGKT